jgi:thiamine biosynthesis lipoprotein
MAPASFKVRFAAMASECEVHLAARDEADARQRAAPAIAEVRRIESAFSRYREDSVVARINRAAGIGWTEIDPETEALFGYADALFASSGGLFDITSGVLRRAWDFRQPRLPDTAALRQLTGLIGWDQVERAPGRIRLPRAGMEIDFGGFGKEYAADRAAAILGAHSGYVNLGGDLRVTGPQPDGSPWQIGIQHPRQADALLATIAISSGALATSGDYERYFELDGRRYCHILDPRSGYPAQHWRSVSVLAPLAVAAGSVATIAMLKQDEAIAFLDDAGLAYLAVAKDGAVIRKDAAP